MINMENIGLIGHSRGGEAISIAANKSTKHNIKALMAIAPTDRLFREYIGLEDKSYITLSGANDGDLEMFRGRSQFNRTTFSTSSSNSQFNLKASYFIEGVNHAQFNTDWGNIDSSSLGELFYGKNRNIKPEDQREISKILSELFFGITLKGKNELLPQLKTISSNSTLPDIRYITDYIDSEMEILYNFDQEYHKDFSFNNLDTTYIKHFSNRALELSNIGTMLISRDKEIYSDLIGFSLASKESYNQKLTCNIYLKGIRVSSKTLLLEPYLDKNIFKTNIFQRDQKIEEHFQSYEIPVNGKWDKIEIIKNKKGFLLLDNIRIIPSI